MATVDVNVPDIGDFKDVPVIEVHVKAGDMLKAEDPILTLESDKATLEVPAPSPGKIIEVLLKAGDKVSRGSPMLRMETASGDGAAKGAANGLSSAADKPATKPVGVAPEPSAQTEAIASAIPPPIIPPASRRTLPPPIALDFGNVHASPSVRRLARELEVDLTKVRGTGEKGRVTLADVKTSLVGTASGGVSSGSGIPEIPAQDFAKYGVIEVKPLSRMKKLSGAHLSRAWLNVPHVTHTDDADITDLEVYRKMLDAAGKEKGYRVTLIAFLLKASVSALKAYPEFNSSLSPDKGSIIYKKYYNIGVAVDTPDGLVVPCIKDVDRKGIVELSQELGAISKRMRDGKITPADIQGATFSISSLGGIGGTAFTPIVSAPEVAILGVARSVMKPVWDGKAFQPRMMLPLCVSYDHRVIDGALAARFTRHLADMLEDTRQLVL
jgi:pyruvate dehydrogenase E2 component (dihydrolipoamide acetyltransferase)